MSEFSRKQILDSRTLAYREYKVIITKHNKQNILKGRKFSVEFYIFTADSLYASRFSRHFCKLCGTSVKTHGTFLFLFAG